MQKTSTGAGLMAYTQCLTIVVKSHACWVRISRTLIGRARNFNTALWEKSKRMRRCVLVTLKYYRDQKRKDAKPLRHGSPVIVGVRDVWLNRKDVIVPATL